MKLKKKVIYTNIRPFATAIITVFSGMILFSGCGTNVPNEVGTDTAWDEMIDSFQKSLSGKAIEDSEEIEESTYSEKPEKTEKPAQAEKTEELSKPEGEELTEKQTEPANIAELQNPRVSHHVTTWDCVWFGNYYQNSSNEKEPVKWRVLSVENGEMFLLADQNLDCQPYNKLYTDMTWENCTLRAWLNNDFLQEAFSLEEQYDIVSSTVVNDDNSEHGTEGGNDTQDKIFLLSIAEACNGNYGFYKSHEKQIAARMGYDTTSTESSSRLAYNTAYAKERGAYTEEYNDFIDGISIKGVGGWWLRSSGEDTCSAALVSLYGESSECGDIDDNFVAVRPALKLPLSSSLYTYAGTVGSDGSIDGIKVEDDFQQESPSDNTEDNEAVSSLDYLKIYHNYLSADSVLWGGEQADATGISFLLIDVDEDGQPELFLENRLASHAQSNYGLFGIKDGEVVEFMRNDEINGYYPHHKIVKTSYYGMGSSESYYKVEDGNSTCVLMKETSYLDEDTSEISYSKGSGEVITEEDFESLFKNYLEGEAMKEIQGELVENNSENRAKIFLE